MNHPQQQAAAQKPATLAFWPTSKSGTHIVLIDEQRNVRNVGVLWCEVAA